MERILVGLDASARAPGVLETSTELARRTGGKLILFRAVGVPQEVPIEAYSMTPASLGELLEREAKVYLDKVGRGLPSGMLAETVVYVGTAWRGLCSVAEERRADMIVIGSHGYSGLDRLLGTTAAKVVNHATQSVLVVRGRPDLVPHTT